MCAININTDYYRNKANNAAYIMWLIFHFFCIGLIFYLYINWLCLFFFAFLVLIALNPQ